MKRILKACIPFTLLLSLIIPMQAVPATAAEPAANEDWTRFPLIAHALGGIDGVDYTNSLEAFQTNYDKGQRLFEVDFSITKDGLLAARHDWMGYLATKFEQDIPAEKLEEPLTLKEFKSYKILENYTPLSFADVARLSKKYPDVYFITDTKETDPELVKQQFTLIRDTINRIDPTLIDRFIPEIYSPEMLDTVREIIPFKHVIFSLYLTSMEPAEVVQFVKEHDVHVVAMPEERATKSFIKDLSDVDVVTYVHSLNKVKDVKKLMRIGVHGVYTDFLSYKDLGIDEAPLLAAGQPDAEKSTVNTTQLDNSVSIASADTVLTEQSTAPATTTWEKIKLLLGKLFNS
ncbi:glycerophosphoryl diester phosphodiesterase [Paenibacillus sp. 1_12]|uniref:phosphatidylinositol-specific phospholipase C/glycerophosphodiester phosphodiesterase family protein n=1 Tax=Paenibacillus sp. 1_12 TaxID=1566278 RepID=UPI0008E68A71|nr:phosphatidylinositol-specific phospholipase C/glycerophosphodiester phosphodiesterase family protein [Paenibacillus sp. 1_12]SFL37599.1 glycerophosphoryl diester phosphodiesterase [Paenibacillus sp. 1_12]